MVKTKKTTNFNASLKKSLENVGIKASSEEKAREQLLAFLEENDVKGVDDEDIEELISMAEAFYDHDTVSDKSDDSDEDEDTEEEDDDDDDEEDDDDDDDEEDDDDDDESDKFDDMSRKELKKFIEDEELEIKVKKKMSEDDIREAIREEWEDEDDNDEDDDDSSDTDTDSDTSDEDEDDDEGDDEDEEDDEDEVDLDELDRSELKDYIKENELDIKVKKKWSDDDIREAIIEAEADDEDDDEDDIEELKDEVKKRKADKKSEKKPEKSSKTSNSRMEKFDARNDKSHRKYFNPFVENYFSEDDYEVSILKQGFTIRVFGDNSKTTVLNFDELKITSEDEVIGNLYMNRLRNIDEALEVLPEEYHEFEDNDKPRVGMFRSESHPSVKGVTTSDVFKILDAGLFNLSVKAAGKSDKQLGKNRDKLEEKATGKKKKDKKKKKNKNK